MDYLGLGDNDFDSDDSFFNDPKLVRRQKAKSETAKKDDKSIKDIFGFEESEKQTAAPTSTLPTTPAAIETETPATGGTAKTKVRFNVDETQVDSKTSPSTSKSSAAGADWLGLGSSAVETEKDPASTTSIIKTPSKPVNNLFDDVLPRNVEQRKAISFDDILKDSKVQRGTNLERAASQQIGPRSLETDTLRNTGGGRRGRRGSGTGVGVPDLLGLFGSGTSVEEHSKTTGEQVNKQQKIEQEKIVEQSSIQQNVPGWLGQSSLNKSDTKINSSRKTADIDDTKSLLTAEDTMKTPQQSNTIITNNNTMSNLQTQESFLLLSMQLKNYEGNLTDIKKQQEMILKKQEHQFDMFLNKYVEKQKSIELEMLNQQERINNYIRKFGTVNTGVEYVALEAETTTDTNILEEKIVKNLKQRHEEEFFLMEESYKKQISLLEKSAEQLEQRLNDDLQNVRQSHDDKVNIMKTQHNEEIEFWKERFQNIEKHHTEECHQLKTNHARMIDEIETEFLEQIERIKEQRIRENDLLHSTSSTEFAQKLTTGIERLGRNEEILEKLQEKVYTDYNILSVARERTLENKEKEIQMMRTSLEKCREQAEKDRSQLFTLIRTLEGKLSEQMQNSQEERWAMQQAAATLAARSVAFDREVEFSRASINREREQLKTLKDTLLAEQERITLELTEEKLKLTAEKSRQDVSAKLLNNYEIEKMKTEAETAIQVAKELTEKLTNERSFVLKQKNELENYRRTLMEKERQLLEREDEIEQSQQNVHRQIETDRKMMQETKFLENRYKEKLADLQQQTFTLSSREKKLAEEKLMLSKERLALYTTLKTTQNSGKKCMLCQAEGRDNISTNIDFNSSRSGAAADTDFLRYKIETVLDDDERAGSEVSKEESSSRHILSKN